MSQVRRNGGEAKASLAQDLGAALLSAEAPEGLIVSDAAGRVEFCNRIAARLLRLPPDAAVGRTIGELAAAGVDETLRLRLESSLHSPDGVEFVAAAPGAEDGWIEVRALPLRRSVAWFLKDVTERARSERQLRRKEQRLLATNESLRMAHQAAHGASWEWRAGRGLRWTDLAAARELTALPAAWTDEELVANWREITPPDSAEAAQKGVEQLSRTGAFTGEFQMIGSDGRTHWMQVSAVVVERDRDGRPVRVSGITLDVTERKSAEEKLRREVAERRRAESHQQLLIHELNHRVKNMLATVQSVARQTLGQTLGKAAIADFEDRLMALAWTHDILTREHWAGASLSTIVQRTMAAHVGADSPRATLDGPDLKISPRMALALAIGLHELSTNAAKYGALSGEGGAVAVRWRADGPEDAPQLVLDWREEGGPPVSPPTRRGFGSRLIERGLAAELGGEVSLSFEPNGVRCRIRAPLETPDVYGRADPISPGASVDASLPAAQPH